MTLRAAGAHRVGQGAGARARLRRRRHRARRPARARARARALDRGRPCRRHGLSGRRLGERLDPRRVLPGAASVVAVALNYYQGEAADPSWAPVARYAWGRDYHDVIAPRLAAPRRLSRRSVWRAEPGIRRHGPGARARPRGAGRPRLDRQEHDAAPAGPRVVVLHRRAADHRRARARCAAARSLRLVPRLSRRLPDRGLSSRRTCSTPAAASRISPSSTAARSTPSSRSQMGEWQFGCDLCQSACPWNRKAPVTGEAAFAPVGPYPGAGAVLEMTDDELRRRFAGTPLLRAEARRPPAQCRHRARQCPSPRSPWRRRKRRLWPRTTDEMSGSGRGDDMTERRRSMRCSIGSRSAPTACPCA